MSIPGDAAGSAMLVERDGTRTNLQKRALRGKERIGVEWAATIPYLVCDKWKGIVVKILAVEDQPEYLEMLQMVMSSLGHSLIIAKNGIEAIGIIEKEKIDVILSDVAMPSMDGLEFHKKIRATPTHKETPFIFLTGVSNLKQVKAECSTKNDLLLQKPVSVERLLKMFSGQISKQL